MWYLNEIHQKVLKENVKLYILRFLHLPLIHTGPLLPGFQHLNISYLLHRNFQRILIKDGKVRQLTCFQRSLLILLMVLPCRILRNRTQGLITSIRSFSPRSTPFFVRRTAAHHTDSIRFGAITGVSVCRVNTSPSCNASRNGEISEARCTPKFSICTSPQCHTCAAKKEGIICSGFIRFSWSFCRI